MKFIKLAKNKKKATNMEKYKINSSYFNSLNVDTLKNLLNESNNLLKETQDSIKSITDKSNDLFKILVVVVTALIGFVFTSNATITTLILTSYYILVFGVLLYKLYFIVYPKLNALVGTEPKNILVKQMIGNNIENTEKRFVFVMLQSKQRAIDNNRILHHELFIKYKSIVRLLLITIAFSIVIFLLCRLYLNLFQDTCLCQCLGCMSHYRYYPDCLAID